MQCAICGEKLENVISKDHIYPRAIYKWLENELSREEYVELKHSIESSANIIKTHPKCNKAKSDTIINTENLFLDAKRRIKLEEKERIIRPYLTGYLALKTEILKQQEDTCYICKKRIDLENGVLTRKDRKKVRTRENAYIICEDCIYGTNEAEKGKNKW